MSGFSFNPPASSAGGTSGGTGSLFGSTAPSGGGLFGSGTASGTTGGLFGNATNQPAASSSGPSLFGSGATSGSQQKPGSLFGSSATGGGWSFGQKPSENTAPASSAPSAFGTIPTTSAPAPSPFSFPSSTGGSNLAPSGGGSGFGTKPASTELFAGTGDKAQTTSAPLFGSIPTTTTTTSAATPATQKPAFSFPSTTPAQTPPQPSGAAPSGGIFGSKPATTTSSFTSTTPAAPAPSTGLFGNLSGASTSSTPFSGFGSKPTTSQPATSAAAPAFTSTTQPQSASGLFGGNSKPIAQQPAVSQPPKFPGFAISATTSTASPLSSTPTAPPSGSTAQPTSSAPTSGSSFSFPTTTSGPSATPAKFGSGATPASSATPLGGLFAPKTSAPAITFASSVSTTTPATTAPATGFNLFSKKPDGDPSASSGGLGEATGGPPSSSGPSAPAAPAPAGSTPNILGASSTGAPPDARSRLKNKSMDDILTRWATDLAKHQKEFQRQAKQVQAWDALLVKNTDRIGKLNAKTFLAERDAAEVEKQLTLVENEQKELEAYLEIYEATVEKMEQQNSGPGGVEGGVDLERQRTYQASEKLTERLDGLNRDLSDVITEVNGVSAMLQKTNGPDDQLSQIVRVLNSHLQQLQMIDVGASQLQAKVDAAKKESKGLNTSSNGWHGVGTDPAEDFYKSFMGRR